MIAEQIGDKGEIAFLSAAANATNQNAWIELMNAGARGQPPRTSSVVDTVYGDDDDQKSFDETAALLQTHPNLKGIISPRPPSASLRPLATCRPPTTRARSR